MSILSHVRFTYDAINAKGCSWEQAFSAGGGATWEANWTMEFARIGEVTS